MSISDDLHEAVAAIDGASPDRVVASVLERRSRRRARRRGAQGVLAGVAVVVALAVTAAVVQRTPEPTELTSAGADPSTSVDPSPTAEPVLPSSLDQADVDAAWRDLPPGPLGERIEFASAWTGRELVVWGGLGWTPEGAEVVLDDGAAYDPASGTWRSLPTAPGPGRAGAVAVWTGEEVLVLGGREGTTVLDDGLAYDPELDRWRTLPAGPLDGRLPQAATWAGDRVVVTLVRPEAGDPDGAVASFAPTSGAWTLISSPGDFNRSALVTTADIGVVLLTGLVDDMNTSVRPDVAVHRLAGDRWEAAAGAPGVLPQAFGAAAVGGGLVVVDHDRRSAIADSALAWRQVEQSPTDGSGCDPQVVAVEDVAIFWQCGGTAAIDASGRWVPLSRTTGVQPRDTAVVSTGDVLLVWGRDFDAHRTVLRSLDLSVLR